MSMFLGASRGGSAGGGPFGSLKAPKLARTSKKVNYEFGKPSGDIKYGFGDTGATVQAGLGQTQGGIKYGFGDTNANVKSTIDDAGQIRDVFGTPVRDVSYDVAPGELSIRGTIGDAGPIADGYDAMGVGAKDRDKVEDILIGRLDRRLGQDRKGFESSLINRGLRPGTAAYDRRMRDFDTRHNDARMSAILSAGQEHSRVAGLARDEAMFGRDSQAQRYAQLADRARFGNTAQGQEFGQNLARHQAENQAQQQEFQQEQARGLFGNQAQSQRFGQNLAETQTQNAAQGQEYGQLADRARFGNAAQGQDFSQILGRGQFNNAAQGQQFMQLLNRAQLNNAAQGMDFGQNLERGNFYNRAQQQVHNQDMDRFNADIASFNANMAGRNQAIGEASAFTNLLQRVAGGAPTGYGGTGSLPTIDYGALSNNNYRNQVAAAQGRNAGLLDLAGRFASGLSS